MTKNVDTVEPVNGYFGPGKSRSAAELARSMPAIRASKQTTARGRIAASKTKKTRAIPMAPTPERLAKGDMTVRGGVYRALPVHEQLRDQGALALPKDDASAKKVTESPTNQLYAKSKFDHDARTNEAMFQAAEKLRRHFDGCAIGVKAQDLNRIISSGASDDLTQEEAWVHHFDTFRTACKLMGWSEANPYRGAGRIVVAVVCYEMTVTEAAVAHIGAGRTEVVKGQGMDRLREGLFALATHWRML